MPSIHHTFKAALACERGTVALLFGLAVVPMTGIVAVAVDYNRASNVRAQLQSAVDAAALAAVRRPENERVSTATAIFNANTASIAGQSQLRITQSSFSPDASRHHVRAEADVDTLMARVIGRENTRVAVRATAVVAQGAPAGGGCFYALDPGTNGALRINGGSRIDAPQCVAHVHSSIDHSFIINSGSRFDVTRTCVRGTALKNPGHRTGAVDERCNPDPDPFAGRMPTVSTSGCDFTNLVFNPQPTPIRLTPGRYCGNTIFNGGAATVQFDPGLFIIKGPMIFNSGSVVRGSGVTFYFADQGTFMMNGQMEMRLEAPTSGTYANILMFQEASLPKRNFIFNNERGQKLTGVIWLPTQDIQFNSTSYAGESDRVTVVANTAILNAQAEWRITPAAGGGGGSGSSGPPRLEPDTVALSTMPAREQGGAGQGGSQTGPGRSQGGGLERERIRSQQ